MSKMQGQVYIFDFGDKIKVGFSTDVQKRLRTIELSSGVKAKQVYAVNGSREIESIIHSWLDNRLEGEFFAVPFHDAKSLLNNVVNGKISSKKNIHETFLYGKITYTKLLKAMEEKGITSYTMRKDNIIGQATYKKIKEGGDIDTRTIAKLCKLLNCQPGDILEYVEEDQP